MRFGRVGGGIRDGGLYVLEPMRASMDAAATTDTNRDMRLEFDVRGQDASYERPSFEAGLCGQGCAEREDCGSDGTGNGLDDDCDGRLDNGCAECVPGNARECYRGFPPELRGACHRGVYICGEFGWDCSRDQEPIAETCNGVDDNCDGNTDEGLSGCNARARPVHRVGRLRHFRTQRCVAAICMRVPTSPPGVGV